MSKTIRILSLDGGGMRGYFSAVFLEQFCARAGIAPHRLAQTFDYIVGTSIGGIQALGYSIGLTPTALQNFFTEQGPWIFTITSLVPGVRAGIVTKIQALLTGAPFYRNENLTEQLNLVFGERTLADIPTGTTVVIPSFEWPTRQCVLFSNRESANLTGRNERMASVALATSSAPLYFPPALFSGKTYVDGGVFQNNPAQLAINLMEKNAFTAQRCCVLSVGTGLGDIGFHPAPTHRLGVFEGAQQIMDLVSVGIAGPQEAVHIGLNWRGGPGSNNFYYYRFNTVLDSVNQDIEMDNSSTSFLNYLREAALNRITEDSDNLFQFIDHFNVE